MKKFLLLIIATSIGISSYADTPMTVGDMMYTYFEELLPNDHFVYGNVDVEFIDVPSRGRLEGALEKAIYHELFPNASVHFYPDRPAVISDLGTLLKYHFGVQVSSSKQELTREKYESLLAPIRKTYSYALIQKQNSLVGEFAQAIGYEITKVSNFQLLDQVYQQLKSGHYDADIVSDEDLIYGAAHGLADTYGDAFTTFLDPADVTLLGNELSGSYAGIGAYVDTDESGYTIITGTIPDSPARLAGLQSGDRIISIDGKEVPLHADLYDVVSDIIGDEGTIVDLRVQRGTKSLAFQLMRAIVQVPFVQDTLLSTGEYYIALYSIGTQADDEFVAALGRFADSGATKLIFDLRDNPGGTLGETRIILDALIGKNKRVITIKTKDETFYMYSYQDPVIDLSKYDVAILINGGTASAAEIIAGTIEDYFPDEVSLVGEQTYGKGSVQQVLSFSDGSGLKFTTAKWFTGKSRISIDGVGITPEYSVAFRDDFWKKGIDIQLETARSILSK